MWSRQRERFPAIATLSICLALCVTTTGCRSSLVRVKGKVVRAGEPVCAGKIERLQVVFHALVDDAKVSAESYPANVRPDGTFEVPGKEGKGIPRGRYRISVEGVYDASDRFQLKGAFGSQNSPLVREITGSEVTIDLARPTG